MWYHLHPRRLGLANLLTLLRIGVIPLFMLAYFYAHRRAELGETGAARYYFLALALFGLASLTDYLDGKVARARGVTELGKFLDPVADKLLVLATLLAFKYWDGLIPIWMIAVFAGREVVVTLVRSLLVARGERVISASMWGKVKTNTQMFALVASFLLLILNSAAGYPIESVHSGRGPIFWMMLIPLALTVASGVEFFYSNRARLGRLTIRGNG
ncbi:MAG: CDP-diacylglycerol--glycerol-3-phosphate 3-phosphatidyltransferase [Candidatus Poribacteria bacterium]|nr:MAG: CDP-diacylglycerol--glycerol-3-phosphate 3-phosphatidyltransferase [Candidatus Poribacteria bacterium]